MDPIRAQNPTSRTPKAIQTIVISVATANAMLARADSDGVDASSETAGEVSTASVAIMGFIMRTEADSVCAHGDTADVTAERGFAPRNQKFYGCAWEVPALKSAAADQ